MAASAREFTGRWHGSLRAGSETEHRAFLDQLRSAAGADLLHRCGLTRYALYERGNQLDVVFRSEKPSIIAGFLRNKKLWPEYWEFGAPGSESDLSAAPTFEWRRA